MQLTKNIKVSTSIAFINILLITNLLDGTGNKLIWSASLLILL